MSFFVIYEWSAVLLHLILYFLSKLIHVYLTFNKNYKFSFDFKSFLYAETSSPEHNQEDSSKAPSFQDDSLASGNFFSIKSSTL